MKFTNHHVSDIVTRVKNAAQRGHATVSVPNVRVVKNVLNILAQEGYIESFEAKELEVVVTLKYDNKTSVISKFEIVSKPSKRVYKKAGDIPSYYNGLGVTILSTSKGVLSDSQAIEAGVGGEVLCQVF